MGCLCNELGVRGEGVALASSPEFTIFLLEKRTKGGSLSTVNETNCNKKVT